MTPGPGAIGKGMVTAGLVSLAGCTDIQSTLSADGPEAERILSLSLVMIIGATIILVGTVLLVAVAMYGPARWRAGLARESLVMGGGIVFPVIVLTALLAYGLLIMRADGNASSADAIEISVIGEQWWWRVVYTDERGTFETANEIRVPTGRPVRLTLTTADVIHSFWVPNVGGKVDMIPGRINYLTFTVDEEGVSRGQCTEYCGGAHALMALHLVAMEPAAFETWRDKEAGAAMAPDTPLREFGQLVFLTSGCGGCHSIRGTEARGVIGPDLTHVGGRLALAAGVMPNTPGSMADWIVASQHIKPENKMPPFAIFSQPELDALAAYLDGLG